MRFRKRSTGDSLDTDSAFSDDASSMLSSESSSTSSVNGGRPQQVQNGGGPKKVLVDIYCADGSTKESILVDPQLTVGGALKIMAEKSCVDCHVKWGLVERLPELCMERCLEDDEKLLRVVSCWKPQTSNRLIFSQRPEKYDLFRRPERYLLDPYDKAMTDAVMTTPWDPVERQSLLQRCIDTVNEASSTQLEGPLWLKAEGKKSWKKFHFILRDGNIFQTTKSKKGSVHDVHCVASLAAVRVFNGLGWKRKHKAPTDFCFALKPPEVQEKKAHIRYLCAENEFVKWGWYSMLRLTLGPPQQLVDNYNAQLGVPVPQAIMQGPSTVLSRSESITSNGDCSMSSGIVSEVDEENGFDVDFPDGGTIKRKPQQQQQILDQAGRQERLMAEAEINLPLPPPPETEAITPTEAGHMPLPPPPKELETMPVIREELYPCGIMRTRFQPTEMEMVNQSVSQMSLLNSLPSQPPPSLNALTRQVVVANNVPASVAPNATMPMPEKRNRKITFNEFVQSIEDSQWEPLKGRETVDNNENMSAANEQDNGCKEQDVSNWVLESLRHCSTSSSGPTTMTANSVPCNSNPNMVEHSAARPKLYNGRTVPNCFSPEEVQVQQRLAQQQEIIVTANANNIVGVNPVAPPNAGAVGKFAPAPPRRSNGTHLSQF